MEAPAKTGGTRKQRNGRDIIGRLRTLPPIQFLTKHNPLRLRRKPKVKLGFDQPPHEIKRLALPWRSAPPSLQTRLVLRLGRFWCTAAATVGRLSGKAERVRNAALGRARLYVGATIGRCSAAWRLVSGLAIERMAALKESQAGQWCTAKLQVLAQRLEIQEASTSWHPTQAPMLMARTQRVRGALVGLVACEWTAMVGLCLMLCILALRGRTWDTSGVNSCGLIVCLLSLTGLGLQSWHHRLVASWRSLELFICGECGELRNFSPSRPCPRCGNELAPVFPGQVPQAWSKWRYAISAPVVAGPCGLVAALFFAQRLLASTFAR